MSIVITVTNTPAGVVIDAQGSLHAIDDAAWVARNMIEHAAPMFAGGKPVLLGGQADPVRGLEVTEDNDGHLCTCDLQLTLEELDRHTCSACGKAILL